MEIQFDDFKKKMKAIFYSFSNYVDLFKKLKYKRIFLSARFSLTDIYKIMIDIII